MTKTNCSTPRCENQIDVRATGSGRQKKFCDTCRASHSRVCQLRYWTNNTDKIRATQRERQRAIRAQGKDAHLISLASLAKRLGWTEGVLKRSMMRDVDFPIASRTPSGNARFDPSEAIPHALEERDRYLSACGSASGICKRCGSTEFYEYDRADRNRNPRVERRCRACTKARERMRRTSARVQQLRREWKCNNRDKIRAQDKRYRLHLRERMAIDDVLRAEVGGKSRVRARRHTEKLHALRPPKVFVTEEQKQEQRRALSRQKYWRNRKENVRHRIIAQQRAMAIFRAALDLGLLAKADLSGLGLSRSERKAFRKREYNAAACAVRELGLV